jgi:FKBP-type peptidyl-prolyl cis-trans isomerase
VQACSNACGSHEAHVLTSCQKPCATPLPRRQQQTVKQRSVRLAWEAIEPPYAGFELGLKGMRVGGQRRIVVPPDLGPPVGPSTFFSAKQIEVFDVELFDIKDCRREGALMFSKVVCG